MSSLLRASSRRSPALLRLVPHSSPTSAVAFRPQPYRRQLHPHFALITAQQAQCRHASTAPQGKPSGSSAKGFEVPPNPTFKSLMSMIWRSLKSDSSRAWYVIRNTRFTDVIRRNPVEAFLAIISLAAAAGLLVYVVNIYYTYFNAPQFTRYPEPIARALRKALYFSNYNPDPQRALKYYKQALELCDEHGLDHFSDDVMGIKIQIAAWLEKIESYQNAIIVLENLLTDCKRWVETMEKSAVEGTLPKLEPEPVKEGESVDADVPEKPREGWWAKRSRILAKAIGISVKLANLYSDEHVLKRDAAHERLIWAVETTLKEMQRRAKEGLKEDEGPWLSPEEVGGSLEALADSYRQKSQNHLALPLYFQALQLCQEPCHIAVLMNNISASFADHPLIAPGDAPVHALMPDEVKTWTTAAEQRASYLASARRWARNALQHAQEPKGEQRTLECDQACVVALSNMGSVLALLGRNDEARQKYQKAVDLGKKLGLDDYAAEAAARLKSLPAA